jgi:hypothetical protein
VLRLVVIAIVFFASAGTARAECAVDRDRFTCTEWHVELFVPPDWELTAQTAYPGILTSGVHKGGTGRLSFAAQRVDPAMTAKTYAEQNRKTLKDVGFRVGDLAAHPTGAYLVDSLSPDRQRRIRQGYVVAHGVAYVLTIAAPTKAWRSYMRAFDDTLRSIKLQAPAPPPEPEPEAETPTP